MDIKVYAANGYSLPYKKYKEDSGFDFITRYSFTLDAGDKYTVHTGLFMEIPEGYGMLIIPRSSTGLQQLHLQNVIGLIDPIYRGEIMINLINNSDKALEYKAGDRIAQGIIVPTLNPRFISVNKEDLSKTERGAGGFGSTN